MQAVMGAISSKNNCFKFAMKGNYFNSNDTIEFLTRLKNFHRHRRLCIFWDNCSIHTGKKVNEWMKTQRSLVSVENPPYSPQNNGIEYLWAKTKFEFRKVLTQKRLEVPMNYSTSDIVENVLENIDDQVIHNCCNHGWKELFSDSRSPTNLI